ncbi:MAG TPA: dihydrolipoyl dehydrogenase [Alphaproteobacteria bacterium]|nr:dihydrolipoyl dehydrogenase [Alphaproteobacteria bacterium]
MSSSYDVVVVGGGPGGYVAAIKASQLGFKTAIIEKENLGGVCLNWGCIPTKALLRTAEIKHLMDRAAEFGLSLETPVKVDIKKVVERSRGIASQLSSGISYLLKKNKITHISGYAKLEGNGKLSIDDKKTIEAKHIILAVGAKPRYLSGFEADGELIWNARHAMTPESLPKSLLVIGSGAIGIEFACFYNTLGVEVSVVELQDRILPQEDVEISRFAQKSLEKQGIKFYLSSTIDKCERLEKGAKITLKTLKGSKELEVEKMITAVGIVGNTQNIGLEKTAIKLEKNQIVTDVWCQTDEKGIYAIGDVTKGPWLAHKASHEAILCVEKIAGLTPHPLDITSIPGCTYSFPQIASVGLTEDKAKELGKKIKVGRFSFKANGKALALGEPEGLIKTIFDETTGELLGAHLVGAEVTEMIQGFVLAKNLETTEAEIMHTIFPHPTLSEMMHEATLDAFGKAIHA